jgi:hypothetical protein
MEEAGDRSGQVAQSAVTHVVPNTPSRSASEKKILGCGIWLCVTKSIAWSRMDAYNTKSTAEGGRQRC